MDFLYDTNLWLGLSFLIFLFICYRFGRDAILNILDTRIHDIKNELENAESLRIEAQEMLAQYQRKHRDAIQEAEKIIANAEKHASEIRKNAEQNLAENLKQREKHLQDRLRRMEEETIQEIREYAANLAIQATAEIIAEKMNKQTSDQLIDESIQAVAQKIH